METKKLYYEDPHLQTFSATVTSCREDKDGFWITLDATAFYPEGGGQPCDMGTINDIPVINVQEKDGQVQHLCKEAITPGTAITGNICWARRFDLMQQHSGEHILSGIVHKRYGYHNVGFHIGKDLVTIDFDGMIPNEALEEIEQEANAILWQNLPFRCYYPTKEELPTIPYRRKKDLPWPVRIVEVPGVDLCACCGTQVSHTGEIGLIKIFSCMKFHQGVRLELACGNRALTLLTKVFEQNRLVCQAFSAKMLETGEAAQRVNQQLAAEKYRSASLQKQIFANLAQGYTGAKNPVHLETDLTPGQVRELADAIATRCEGIAAVLSGNDETGYSICMVSRTEDVRPAGKAAMEVLSGRGGGKADAFQGSCKTTAQQIRDYFHLK